MGRPSSVPAEFRFPLHEMLHERRIKVTDLAREVGVQHQILSRYIVRRLSPATGDLRPAITAALQARGWSAADIAAAFAAPPAGFIPEINHTAQPDELNLPEHTMLSIEAREHFSLPRHPFIDDVTGPQDVFCGRDQRYVRDSMYYAAKQGGFVAVVGESGSGKSTLRRDLIERIRADGEPVVIVQPKVVDKAQLTAAHICDAIIADLSQEKPKVSLEGKARQVERILRGSARAGNSHVLVIEEAHDLSKPTLKYSKRFWEMEDGFRKLIGIILIGQPELGDMLDERRNPDLREVIRRCEIAHLRPLDRALEEYLTLKFKRVGRTLDDLFAAGSMDAIRNRLTRRMPGRTDVESYLYPLVVQNVVSKAMNMAAELGVPKITPELVAKV